MASAFKQANAQPIFEQAHLMADGSLCHAEFCRRLSEAEIPRTRLEGAKGSERRKATHARLSPLIEAMRINRFVARQKQHLVWNVKLERCAIGTSAIDRREYAMIVWEIWIPLLGYAIPMVISPGPGNAMLATVGGRLGLAGSIPFWVGFEAANVALCLAYGFGLGGALHDHPEFDLILKWAGIIYLLYLAWCFIKPSARPRDGHGKVTAKFGIGYGFLSVALNPKIHSMILVMFSQFLDPSRQLFDQVMQITFVFFMIGIFCHFPWIYGGKVILSRFQSERAIRIQGWIFGMCMVAVAAYMALS